MKNIISASRRTDLPKFYYAWLQDVLKAGEVVLRNPVYRDKTYKVDVRPEGVHSIVLWSKDFRNVLDKPMYLENYNLYFQYTINLYSELLEPCVPEYEETLGILWGLLCRYRPEQFNIRFDPVMIVDKGSEITPKMFQERLNAFETLCKDLVGLGMSGARITTSYIQLYGHVARRMQARNVELVNLDDFLKTKLFTGLSEIAQKYGIALFSCSSPILEQLPGFRKGHCIDGALLQELFGGKTTRAKDAAQRPACGCVKSSDIGAYEQKCGAQCVYCYQR